MRAFLVPDWGTPPEYRDLPDPHPGTGEIRVRIHACGLNFADLLMIDGRYQQKPPLPVTLGMEIAGLVEEVGAGVSGLAPGDRVAVFGTSGGLAETGCFPAVNAIRIPDSMPAEQAAAFQVAYGTSHVALSHVARLCAGERLVVLGAAGGVGLTAVEIGALMGAEVVAVARGADRLETCRAAGATHVIDSDADDLTGTLRALGGADVVYDPVGGPAFDAAFRAARPEGRIVVIGFASGEVPQIKANHLLVKNLTVSGFWWGGYLEFRPQVVADSLRTLLDWYAGGRLHPHIGATLPFDRAAEGLALLRDRKVTGKVVITLP